MFTTLCHCMLCCSIYIHHPMHLSMVCLVPQGQKIAIDFYGVSIPILVQVMLLPFFILLYLFFLSVH